MVGKDASHILRRRLLRAVVLHIGNHVAHKCGPVIFIDQRCKQVYCNIPVSDCIGRWSISPGTTLAIRRYAEIVQSVWVQLLHEHYTSCGWPWWGTCLVFEPGHFNALDAGVDIGTAMPWEDIFFIQFLWAQPCANLTSYGMCAQEWMSVPCIDTSNSDTKSN